MKLTIVHPCVGKLPGEPYIRAWQMEPLPAAHLAGLTPKDVEIRFVDDRLEPIDFDEPTDLVAMSVETYTARRSYQIASAFRRRNVPVVMGGFHPTLVPEEVSQYADATVCGEAENSWPQLIRDFQAGRMQRIYRAAARPDIAKASPDRSIFAGKRYLPLHLIEAGRGCTFKCDFCVIQKYFDSTQNLRSIETIVEEIKRLPHRNRLMFFVDDNMVSHPEHTKLLCEALIPLKIRWVSQATITLAHDAELVRLLKASGCEGVLIGFESLNRENLRQMNKSFGGARGGPAAAIAKLHAAGIRIYGTFIFGYDHDTLQSFEETLSFCIDQKLFIVAFNHLTPFPGTPLYQRLQAEGRLLFDKWWLDSEYRYGMIPFQTTLPPAEITRRCSEARQKFYSLSSIMRRFNNPAHWRGSKMIFPYFFINLILRSDADVRYRYPLGDPQFTEPLLPAGHEIGLLRAQAGTCS
ncbi:MAG: radical SAM protein [Bdellovibrionota bacterium]